MGAMRRPAQRVVWRLGLAIWCLAAATCAWPLGVSAQPAPAITITPDRGRCGQAATIRGEGFPPGNQVTLRGPRDAVSGHRSSAYQEVSTVVAADGTWTIVTTLFCPSGDSTWVLVDSLSYTCLPSFLPCIETLFEVSSLPLPPSPGVGYAKGLRVRITSARLPGVPNTGGGGAVAPTPVPAGPLVAGGLLTSLGVLILTRYAPLRRQHQHR